MKVKEVKIAKEVIAVMAGDVSPVAMFWNIPSDCLSNWMQNHITSCICLTFPCCVSSDGLLERRCSCTGCICLTFLHCLFSNMSPNGLHEMRQSHIYCICSPFLLHHVFLNAFLMPVHNKMQNHTGCICVTLFQNAFSYDSLNVLADKMLFHIHCTSQFFLLCAFSDGSQGYFSTQM